MRKALWLLALLSPLAHGAAPDCLAGADLVSTYSAEELVLEPRMERGRYSLGGGLLAYRHEGRVYLPVVDVYLNLELPVPKAAQVGSLACQAALDDAYVESAALGQLLAATLQLDLAQMRLLIKADQYFPVEQRRQRERAWLALSRRSALRNPDAPFKPSPYAWLERPSGTLSLFTSQQPAGGATGSYSLQGSGDLLRMSSRYVFAGDLNQPLQRGSGVLERYDPNGGLLGGLNARSVQIGDVSGLSDALLTSGSSGRGVSFGNTLRGSLSSFGQTVISGLLPDGWSVELLRDGELIAVQTQTVNGRYEFLDVDLEYGGNDFVLNFFGPAGERRTELVSESVGAGVARAGEWQYQAVARQNQFGVDGRERVNVSGLRDLGDWVQTRGRYGFSPWLTQEYGLDAFRASDSEQTQTYASTGLTGRWGTWQAQVRGLSALEQNKTAFEGGLGGRILGASVFARHLDYGGLDSERTRSGGAGLLVRSSQLRLTRTFRSFGDGVIGSIAASRSERDTGLEIRDYRARATLPIGGWFVSNEGNLRQFSGPLSLENADHVLRLRRQIGGVGVRFDVRTRIRPERELDTAQLNLTYRVSRALRLRAASSYEAASEVEEYSVGGNILARQLSVGADVTHREGDGWRLSANLNFSFSTTPDGAWMMRRESLATQGRVSLQAFEDLDQDGELDAGEPLVEGFRPTARRGRPNTDFLTLSPDQMTTVRAHAPRELSPFLNPASEEYNVLPRAGHYQQILVPLRQTGEAEGAVLRLAASGPPKPVPGLRVQAFNTAGQLIAETRTAYDGIFLLDRLPLGEYRLALPAEDLERLTMQADDQRVSLREPGDIAQVGTWLLRGQGDDTAAAGLTLPAASPAEVPAPAAVWMLALSGFTSPISADEALQEYRALLAGMPLMIVPAPQHGLFWVAAGPFASRQEAADAKRLARQRLNIDGFWLSEAN